MEEVRKMLMEGKFTDDWKIRPWGGLSRFDLAREVEDELPCADEPWWEDSSCPSFTGETCTPHVGWCNTEGAVCLSNGHCVCGLDDTGISMCAGHGKCHTRENRCTYFGEGCRVIPADNPSAPW
eukprot:GFYU01031715.1.p1 GENE.GFYU01031715.1~~GFYU01031715.1.p1  ORF type:complete len:137 (-),score=33.93 GFYU01031715.1:44-415(-)